VNGKFLKGGEIQYYKLLILTVGYPNIEI
jgi:hypothetical protein